VISNEYNNIKIVRIAMSFVWIMESRTSGIRLEFFKIIYKLKRLDFHLLSQKGWKTSAIPQIEQCNYK
jgi:hypothetical protein